MNLGQQILRTDAAGMPLEWIDYQGAARLYHLDQVAYALGRVLFMLHGGVNAISGRRSRLTVHTIIATWGGDGHGLAERRQAWTPPLNNPTLFRRDGHLCLYCGAPFRDYELSRDHVTPLSQGGDDVWNNVVAACKRCNHHKAGRTPEQAGMQLLAIPFTPTHAEYIYLKGRRVLSDQMEFLRAHFPRTSPLRTRASCHA